MTLEKDINQQVFRSEYQKAIINLIYTFNWVNEKINRRFEPFDITQQQFNILRILRGAGEPLSTLQIRQRMLDKMSDTSRIVDRLVKKGMVKKSVCREDRRLVDVLLTDKGKKLLQSMDSMNEEMDSVFKYLSNDEARLLNVLLDKIRMFENPSEDNSAQTAITG
ncbi:MAG TPA: MarR family transcriptional regulator [Puia sp.]|jgi:DNA-binding MarR family transcriptional regulator|nr:MarR family transcriptional regulator [Puia sp.]